MSFYTDSEQRTSRIRSEIKQWSQLNTCHWRSVCAVTLTIKQALQSNKGGLVPLTEIQAKKELRHFMTRLNRAVYKSAARFHGKGLRVIPIVEKDGDSRWHYHLAIEPPSHMTSEEFGDEIWRCWSKSPWAMRIAHIQGDVGHGWVYDTFEKRQQVLPKLDRVKDRWKIYMLKKRGKSGLEHWVDCIDLDTLNNP